MNYLNKVVIVTGGAQGIGKAVSLCYAKAGAKVVIADTDIDAGNELEKTILSEGYTCCFIHTDVSEEESVKNLITLTEDIYGTIDVLINNAAIGGFGDFFNTPSSIWNKVIATNLTGPFLCSKYASEIMSKHKKGCIINLGSTRAFMSEPDTLAYSASKGGVIALTHSLAITLGKFKIRVNCISPGWIDVTDHKKSGSASPAILSEEDHNQHPVGRVGIPDDIAKACLYLSSDDAGFITGTNLTIDGGLTVKMIYV